MSGKRVPQDSPRPRSGQHGGFGPNEQRPFLFIHGGGFPAATRSDPVCHVDIAPTILHHLGRPHDGMDGHPLPR